VGWFDGFKRPDGQPTYQPYDPQPGPGSPTVMINGRPASPEEMQQAEKARILDS
jgi:hypothetical protein